MNSINAKIKKLSRKILFEDRTGKLKAKELVIPMFMLKWKIQTIRAICVRKTAIYVESVGTTSTMDINSEGIWQKSTLGTLSFTETSEL